MDKRFLADTDHGLDAKGLELACRAFLDDKDDADRLVYGRRVYEDGSLSLTCPMVPYHELIADFMILAIRAYKGCATIKPCSSAAGHLPQWIIKLPRVKFDEVLGVCDNHYKAGLIEGRRQMREEAATVAEYYPSPLNDLPMAMAIKGVVMAISAIPIGDAT